MATHFGRIGICIAALCTLWLIAGPAAADPANGERLARQWCAACHLVAPDQSQASADVPPFAAIARAPDFSSARIAFFLLDPHPKMPNMSLSRQEATDIAEYIASLRKTQ